MNPRHISEPPRIYRLMSELNDLEMRLIIHYLSDEKSEAMDKAKAHTPKPTIENVRATFRKIMDVLKQSSESQVKY